MISQRLQELKQKQQQFKQSIKDKNLNKVYKFINQSQKMQTENYFWMGYLTQIFAMLTDSQIQFNKFLRRCIIFNIFKIAVNIKIVDLPEKQSTAEFKKNLEYIIRIISTIFIFTASKRDITQQDVVTFHKYICKFLAIVSGSIPLNSKNSQLPKQKVKILQKLYPSSGASLNTVQFICSDLLLWFELFINIKNMLTFTYFDESKAINHLTKILSQVQRNVQPILIWVSMYVLLQETVKIHSIFDQSLQIQSLAIRIVKLIMNEARKKFNDFVVEKYREQRRIQDCQNIFVCILKYNLINLAFSLIQGIRNIQNFKPNILLTIEQITKTIEMIFIGCKEQKRNIQQQRQGQKSTNLFKQRLVKFEIQLNWILFNLKEYEHKLNEPLQKNTRNQQYRDNFNILTHIYSKSFQQLKNEKLSVLLKKFQNILSKQIENNRNRIRANFSQGRKMSQIILYSSFLIQNYFNQYNNIVTKLLQPNETLKLYICLISQYYFSQIQLIYETVKRAQEIVQNFMTNPQLITNSQSINNFKQAVLALSLCISQNYQLSHSQPGLHPAKNRNSFLKIKHYLCSICCKINLHYCCQTCDQPSIRFIYYWEMPVNLTQKWFQYLQMYNYFTTNEINQVDRNLLPQLLNSLNSVTYFSKY